MSATEQELLNVLRRAIDGAMRQASASKSLHECCQNIAAISYALEVERRPASGEES